MSNIALVSDTGSLPLLKALLNAAGHGVTELLFKSITSAELTEYDLVIATSYTLSGSGSPGTDVTFLAQTNKIATAFAAGVPVIAGHCTSSGGYGIYTVGTRCRMVSGESSGDANTGSSQTWHTITGHEILTNGGFTFPTNYANFLSGGNTEGYGAPADFATSVVQIARNNDATVRIDLAAADIGALNLDSVGTAARFVLCGFMSATTDTAYSADRTNAINAAVNWALGVQYTFEGHTYDSTMAPISRRVRLYHRGTGKFLGEVISNATTGAYSCSTGLTGEYMLICLDADGGTKNAIVFDRVVPT